MKMMRKNSGFSAFEVAVALAIVAIIAAFVMPNFLTWLRDYRLRGATNNLISDLEMAKIRAIRENAIVSVVFQAGHYDVFIDNGAGANASNCTFNGDETRLRDRDLPTGVSIDINNINLNGNCARFNGRGVPQDIANQETIPLFNERGTRQISINRIGYIQVQ
jgi:prepilin-type N-terminal cleavage/methylation domain-containing protein